MPSPPCKRILNLFLLITLGVFRGGAQHVVRLGGLFPRFKTAESGFKLDNAGVRRLTAFVMAIREINNKTDGIVDDLLPNTTLQFAVRDSKRDAASAFAGARQLALETFGGLGVSAVIGAASSDPSMMAALALNPTKTPQISYPQAG